MDHKENFPFLPELKKTDEIKSRLIRFLCSLQSWSIEGLFNLENKFTYLHFVSWHKITCKNETGALQ